MRSVLVRSLVVSVALSALSGCAFTQWTDHAYFGSPQDPPVHTNREWVGAVILPAAVLGDIVTAPGQVIALMILGDDGIYAPLVGPGSTPASGSVARSSGDDSEPAPTPRKRYKTNKIKCPADDQWGSLQVDPATREQLASQARAGFEATPSAQAGVRVWGIDAQAHVSELALTGGQREALAGCLQSHSVRRGA